MHYDTMQHCTMHIEMMHYEYDIRLYDTLQ